MLINILICKLKMKMLSMKYIIIICELEIKMYVEICISWIYMYQCYIYLLISHKPLWLSDCCLTSNKHVFFMQIYHGKSKLHSMRLQWCSLCTRPKTLNCIFCYSAAPLKQQTCRANWKLTTHSTPGEHSESLHHWCGFMNLCSCNGVQT